MSPSRALVLAALVLAALALVGCHPRRGRPPAPPAVGTLAGLVRAADTGAGLAAASVVVRRADGGAPVQAAVDDGGAFTIDGLPPGRYTATVYLEQRQVGERAVDIVAGRTTGLDLAIAPTPTPEPVEGAAPPPPAPPLWRFRPPGADPTRATIEGTVTEQADGTRLEGAVIAVLDGGGQLVDQAVSDDDGRFRFDALPPGDYVVSAYYTVLGRGEFEVRRTDVRVVGGDVVVVPLALETTHR